MGPKGPFGAFGVSIKGPLRESTNSSSKASIENLLRRLKNPLRASINILLRLLRAALKIPLKALRDPFNDLKNTP